MLQDLGGGGGKAGEGGRARKGGVRTVAAEGWLNKSARRAGEARMSRKACLRTLMGLAAFDFYRFNRERESGCVFSGARVVVVWCGERKEKSTH